MLHPATMFHEISPHWKHNVSFSCLFTHLYSIPASSFLTLHGAEIKTNAAICFSFPNPLLQKRFPVVLLHMASLALVAKTMFSSFISTYAEWFLNICYITVSVSHKSAGISGTFLVHETHPSTCKTQPAVFGCARFYAVVAQHCKYEIWSWFQSIETLALNPSGLLLCIQSSTHPLSLISTRPLMCN